MRFLIGIFIGIVYTYFVLPKKEGNEPKINPTFYPFLHKGMIIIPYSYEKALHIHHWMFCLLICILALIIDIPAMFTGFCFLLLIQGLTYEDSFDIVCENPY